MYVKVKFFWVKFQNKNDNKKEQNKIIISTFMDLLLESNQNKHC